VLRDKLTLGCDKTVFDSDMLLPANCYPRPESAQIN